VHPDACGGLPKRECLEAAFDSQADIEEALLMGLEWTQINADYQKFFDTFDPEFFFYLTRAVGVPHTVAELTRHLATNLRRSIKRGRHRGKPIRSNRGAAQGDSLSILSALIITTIQFRCIEAEHPNVRMGSVIDDRNFRGPCASVVDAVQAAMEFDKMAGLTNNLKKFVALSITEAGWQKLQQTQFEGRYIDVKQDDILVGMSISTRKAPRRHRQDQRALDTIRSSNRILRTGVGADLKAHAIVVAAIPKILHGNLWNMPSVDVLKKARTACARGQWGKGRATRCVEILLAVLRNPVRADPV
jgi:hypothetical protein